MPCVEITEKISGVNAERVYNVIKDMENYPMFMPNLLSVKILERDACSTVTAWKSSVGGMEFSWVEKDTFDDEQLMIYYEQIKGDLQKMAGRWAVIPQNDGALVNLQVDFELGVPMLAEMINPILKQTIYENCAKMVAGVKKELSVSIASQ